MQELKLLYFLNSKPLKHRFLYFLAVFFSSQAFSQKIVHDWENYVASVNGKPVSVNVDLGLSSFAPVREDSFVIILRVKMNAVGTNGMPSPAEEERLILMEDGLVELLARQSGATFAGRFTQRGIREFYFYAPDTMGFRRAVNQAMQPFSGHEWLSQAKKDKQWENYFNVLYPGKLDLFRIQSRRSMDALLKSSPLRKAPLDIDYFFSFRSTESMKLFLGAPEMTAFQVVSLPVNPQAGKSNLELVLRRKANPDQGWIEAQLVPLFNQAQRVGGEFLGFQGSDK